MPQTLEALCLRLDRFTLIFRDICGSVCLWCTMGRVHTYSRLDAESGKRGCEELWMCETRGKQNQWDSTESESDSILNICVYSVSFSGVLSLVTSIGTGSGASARRTKLTQTVGSRSTKQRLCYLTPPTNRL